MRVDSPPRRFHFSSADLISALTHFLDGEFGQDAPLALDPDTVTVETETGPDGGLRYTLSVAELREAPSPGHASPAAPTGARGAAFRPCLERMLGFECGLLVGHEGQHVATVRGPPPGGGGGSGGATEFHYTWPSVAGPISVSGGGLASVGQEPPDPSSENYMDAATRERPIAPSDCRPDDVECGATRSFVDSAAPDLICRRPAGHEGLHREGLSEWTDLVTDAPTPRPVLCGTSNPDRAFLYCVLDADHDGPHQDRQENGWPSLVSPRGFEVCGFEAHAGRNVIQCARPKEHAGSHGSALVYGDRGELDRCGADLNAFGTDTAWETCGLQKGHSGPHGRS